MTTTIDHNKADVYSRPNARFDAEGNLEIRASAAGDDTIYEFQRRVGTKGASTDARN